VPGDHELNDFSRELRRLRNLRGMTQSALAERMAYHPTRVSQVERGAVPHEDFARQADSVLGAGGVLRRIYRELANLREAEPTGPERELATADFVAWLADHSGVDFRTLYGTVCDAVTRLEAEPPSMRHSIERARRRVSREQIAEALAVHYGSDQLYRARAGGHELLTSIASRPEWRGVAIDLRSAGPTFRYRSGPVGPPVELGGAAIAAATARLASAEVDGTVMVNNPLYRLVDVDLAVDTMTATFTTVDFAHHAMAGELMEGELVDAVSAGRRRMPLRESFLPDNAAAFDLSARTCVGGTPAVLAIARSSRHGGRPDYVTLTQERSRSVLNTAGKLAVIPKAFHQPTSEPADEVSLAVTLGREFEEELLGREDLEQLGRSGRRPHADPLHAQHRTEPMAWLLEQGPDVYRVECVGLGFNMLTGNYEFPCLIVIDDDSWWDRFGHLIELNWEAERVHRHSTLEPDVISALLADPRWGNESLFAFVQGLRRLAEIGDPDRIDLPPIDLET
jgi:transcriptional regulator with XRE-family HTH domain